MSTGPHLHLGLVRLQLGNMHGSTSLGGILHCGGLRPFLAVQRVGQNADGLTRKDMNMQQDAPSVCWLPMQQGLHTVAAKSVIM